MKQVLIRRGSPIVAEVPAPQLTDHSILVEVRCSLISTGTEIAGLDASPRSIVREALQDPAKVAKGLRMIRETGFQRTMALVHTEIDAATPTGYSCAGVVLACGKNASGFSVGQRVACAGAGRANHAEIVSVPRNLVVPVPDECDMESAASATIGAIAIQGTRRADVRFGEFVAVIGLGLIGQLTVQLLNVAGCRTIGTDIESGRIDIAKKFGMSAAANPAQCDPVRAVMEFTGGMGADAVIITASSDSTDILQQAMQMVRRKGRVVVVGAVPLEMQRTPFYEKEADLLISCSYGPGRYDPEYEERGLDYPYPYVRWTENRNMSEYLRLVADGRINFKALVEKTWPISQAPEAYADLKENKRIAVLISIPEGSTEIKNQTRVEINPTAKRIAGQIRTGIIGPGSFVRAVHLPNLKDMSGQFLVSAVAGRNGATAWNIARKYGARYAATDIGEILNDHEIDLVMIASRHDMHARQAVEAAKSGKAIFLEKPAAMNAAELEELLGAVRVAGVPFMVGFNRRFAPLIRNTKSLLDQRSNPALITYRMNAGALPTDSWIQGSEGGGRIIGEACHIFDLFNYLVGAMPTEVVALPLRSRSPHVPATDNFTAGVRYPDGSLCNLIYTSVGSTDLPKESMEVFFDGKTITMDDYRKLSFFGISRKPITKSNQDKGHREELQALADYLNGKAPAPMTLEEIEAATRTSFLVDDIVRSGA